MKKYNIGLDIGTTSVGWAVIDPKDFKVIRKRGKYLWGVRLFEEAKKAEARRLARGIRRRFDRRRERIRLLQEEFREEITKVDVNFYQKLKETFYNHKLDKENVKIEITKEENMLVRNYYKKYPTIYHLRKNLVENTEKMDIRLVYLAIHHIIKYRGNFLYGTGSLNLKNVNLEEKLENLFLDIKNFSEIENNIDDFGNVDYSKLEDALFTILKSDKKRLLEENLSKVIAKKQAKEMAKLLVGDTISINTLFNKDCEEDIKLSFKGSNYEDNYVKLNSNVPNEMDIIDSLKDIYDMVFLKNLFPDDDVTNLSSLMVKRYNNHKTDLTNLKKILRTDRKIYKQVFKVIKKDELSLYDKYVHNNLNYEDFTKELKKYIETIDDTNFLDVKKKILEMLEEGNFLPRVTDVDNGKFPYQLNEDELMKIVTNQGKYYPFLLNTTDDGQLKIVRLLKFRIPYYVGPLNKNSSYAWLVKKQDNIKITPYNFDEVIDLENSSEKFIKRMIGCCTYLLKEKAMPNNSILYSKFKVLNELKQIKVGELGKEERLTKEQQKMIYEELFLKTSGTITDKKFKDYLRKNKDFSMFLDDLSVIGYSADKKFANNMETYISFFGEDGFFKNTSYKEEVADEIISDITVFEDKDILKSRLEKNYPELGEDAIKNICAKRYKGWSSLSKKLLTELFYQDKKTGVSKSILDLMEETSENFMQIINNEEYNFNEKIADYNKIKETKKLSYEVVSDLVTSPANKRGIYQALKVIQEIVEFMGYEPSGITLEMARGEEKKERKDDRKKRLEKIYNDNKKTIENYNKLRKELSECEKIDGEKLFLYFIQCGKSLYSGKPLDINRLNEYEVDHIIPRTLIKDNSIDNKALVLREENQSKAASFVLPETFRNNMKGYWQRLKEIGLISSKKYNSLCRHKFDEKMLEGFINRQLVETRQICKHVANIVSNYYKKTKVSYIPAALSHNYREKFKIYKFREINNYHHAHDAYLAAVLGEYKNKYLKKSIDYLELKEFTKKLYLEKKYQELKDGYVINSLDPTLKEEFIVDFVDKETGELLFDVEKFNETVINTLYRNDILTSKKVEFHTKKDSATEFYNKNASKKGTIGQPLKKGLSIDIYGSYTKVNSVYAVLVKYIKKTKEQQKMVGVPIIIFENSKNDSSAISNYLKKLLGIDENTNIEIIRDKILFNSLLNWEGQLCYLVGASDTVEVCNAAEFHISKEKMQEWQDTFLRLFKNKKEIIVDEKYEKQLVEIIEFIKEKIKSNYKLYTKFIKETDKIFSIEFLKNIDIKSKEKIILETLKLLKTDSTIANLKDLGCSTSGRQNEKTIKNTKIINKSVTGLWEHKDEF